MAAGERRWVAGLCALLCALLSPFVASGVPAQAAAGSLISGTAWYDTALNQTRPAAGALPVVGATVQLLDSGTAAVVATTTTSSTGAYSFANAADGTYLVRITAPANTKFPTALNGNSNVFTSTGTPSSSTDPYLGVTAPVTVAGATKIQNQDAGLQPIATLNVQPLKNQPGYNCLNSAGDPVAQTDNGNCNTSTLSNVSQGFALSVSNLATGQVVKNVYATFTFTPKDGAVLSMPSLPTGCATSVVSPTSSVTGNLTLVCNIGNVNSAQIVAVVPVVVPQGSSPNNSSFTTSVQVKANDGTAVDSNVVTNPRIVITGSPKYATDKGVAGNAGPGTYTVNGVAQLGYQLTYSIHGYPQTVRGSTQLPMPLTIPDAGIAKFPNAVVVGCGGYGPWYNQTDLSPIQSCPVNKTATQASPWNFTFTKYAPNGTQCRNLGGTVCFDTGTDQYAATFTVFVPRADVNKAANPAWQPGDPDPTGSVSFSNCFADSIDGKTDATGQLNNGTGVMAGTRCAPSSFAIPANGFPTPIVAFKQYIIDGVATKNGWFVGPGEPNVQAQIQYVNGAAVPDPNLSLCDYFDVSTMNLTATNPTQTAGLPAGFRVEYGVAPNTVDDQVGTPAVNSTYPNDPVYGYANSDQNTIGSDCTRYTGTWSTNPAADFGADWQQKVNLVRVAPIPGYTPTPAAAARATVSLVLNFTVLSRYNGGPHAGQTIPTGAYIPNVGSWDRGPLDPTFSSETARVYYKQVLPLSTNGSKTYVVGAPSYGGGGGAPSNSFNGNGVYATGGSTTYSSWVGYANTGQGPDFGFLMCDYVDVSTVKIAGAQPVFPTNNGNGYRGASLPAGYQVQYGVAANTVNDQVAPATVGNGYKAPIFSYSNADQVAGAKSCGTLDAGWTTNPAAAFGANWQDKVNVVRVAPIPGTSPAPHAPPNFQVYLATFLVFRASYNGGPNDGQPIPQGAYIPNVGSWDTPQNPAAPVSTQTGAIAFQAYQLGLAKTVNTSAAYQPGGQIQWTLTPQITAGAAGRSITGVKVTDPIPANTTYNADCTTQSLPAGVTVTYNAATNAVTFSYANTFTVNPTLPQNLPAVLLCTDIVTTAKPGVTIPNSATVVSDQSAGSTPSNTASITLAGAGKLAISKSVDKQVITSNSTYNWKLTWANTTTVSFAAPQIIDVLPYNGDGSSGASSQRLSGSSTFAGTNVLTGALAQPTYSAGGADTGAVPGTWYYTTAAPTTIQQNPGNASNANPGTGGSIWVPAASISDWTKVTGIYFSSTGFFNGGNVVTVTIPMRANNGTVLGDLYVNQAELYSSSTPDNPVVTNDPYTQIPGLTIAKSPSSPTVTRAGQQITYTFAVANQGAVSLSNVSVDDTQTAPSIAASLGPITCTSLSNPAGSCSGSILATLAGGQTANFTAVYTVTQADVDKGTISDSAVASAVTNPGNIPVTSTPSAATVTAPANPGISVVKSANPATTSPFAVGSRVTYTFDVTNSGNVTLTGATVADTQTAPATQANLSALTCRTLSSPSGSCSGTSTTLLPGQTASFSATYTVTQADVDNGTIKDSAVARGTPPSGTAITSTPSEATVTVPPTPEIRVTKSADPASVGAVGDVVTYTFVVTNSGNVSLTGATLTDTQTAPAGALTSAPVCKTLSSPSGTCSGTSTTLRPGQSASFTATYTATQADLDQGSIKDSAVASGKSPSGAVIESTPATANVPVTAVPSLSLLKSALPTTLTTAGETVAYSFAVTNTGKVTVSGVNIADSAFSGSGPLSVIDCPAAAASLAPGATVTCTATYALTQADVDAGTVTNIANAKGTAFSGPVTSNDSSAAVTIAPTPKVSIAKSAIPATVGAVGDVVTYTFVVTNTGNVTLTGTSVTDTQAAPAGALTSTPACQSLAAPAGTCAGASTTLLPGQRASFSATYTATQADLDHGSIDDSAVATGTPPSGPAVTSTPATASVPVTARPSLGLEKSVDPTTVSAAGQSVVFSYRVTNTGNVTLSAIGIDEGTFSGTGVLPAETCAVRVLAPGQSTTCTAPYAVTQADADAGVVNNTAVASGQPPGNGTRVASDPSSAVLTVTSRPGLTLAKSALPTAVAAAGDVVTYSFEVTNSGTVTLSGIAVAETAFSGSGSAPVATCPSTTLAPGASTTCTATYAVTQADVDAGPLTNTATASGRAPGATTDTVSDPSSASVTTPDAPELSVSKSADPTTVRAVGETVTYTFAVRNTGNVTLTAVAIEETGFSGTGTPSAITCAATTLAPKATTSCTSTYQVTQADLDSDQITNTARAVGLPPGSTTPVTSPVSKAEVDPVATPGLKLVKTVDPTSVPAAGTSVTYRFAVTNTGNVSLSGLSIAEQAFSGTGRPTTPVCESVVLAPTESTSCTASYTVTQADVDAGQVTNTAVARTSGPARVGPVTSAPSDATLSAAARPEIKLTKSVTPSQLNQVGERLVYTFVVTNSGNTTLTGVKVVEGRFTGRGAALELSCPADTTLPPGGQLTCTAPYTVTQDDVDASRIDNDATATGLPPGATTPISSPPAEAHLPFSDLPGITLQKVPDPATVAAAGDLVTYRFLVTNTGNVTLRDIAITETQFSGTGTAPVATCPAGVLLPGGQKRCQAEYRVTQADVDAGRITNVATAAGTEPNGTRPTSDPANATVIAPAGPALTVAKTATPATVDRSGAEVTYRFLVTNTGNVSLTEIGLEETRFSGTGTPIAPVCPETSLAPKATTTCTATYRLTQADVDAGTVTNEAVAHGRAPGATELSRSAPDDALVTAVPRPSLGLAKSVVPTTVAAAGEQVAYSFAVTNTGNVTLGSIGIDETAFTGTGAAPVVSCPVSSLPPGGSTSCTATYVVTQADVDAGTVDNTARARGTAPQATTPTVSDPSTAAVTANPAPELTLEKSVTPTRVAAVGDVATYSFLVTNTGNVTLTGVGIDETRFTGSGTTPVAACPVTELAPGASTTCSATYTVRQDDLDRGTVDNTAVAVGTTPGRAGSPGVVTRSAPDTATVTADFRPGFVLVKTADPVSVPAAGASIAYSFKVTNTGNVTLTDITVEETAFSGTGRAPVPVCPTGPLAPGAQLTCKASYTVTQADADAGVINNTAVAHDTQRGRTFDSSPSDATVPVPPVPQLTLVKSVSPDTVTRIGSEVTYSFEVTNSGNVTMSGIGISEVAFSGTNAAPVATCARTSLAPGERTTCTAGYTISAADAAAGGVTNTATASGTAPGSTTPTVSQPSSAQVVIPEAPSLTLTKTATPEDASSFVAGTVVTYTITATNTGNVPIVGLVVKDVDFTGTGDLALVCQDDGAPLAPGQARVCTTPYTITAADVIAGSVNNLASATGRTPSGADVPPPPRPRVQIPVPQQSSVRLVKTATAAPSPPTAGDTITYDFEVTNTGTSTLTAVAVSDPMLARAGIAVSCPAAPLAAGASVACTAAGGYRVSQADLDAGSVSNTASVAAAGPCAPGDRLTAERAAPVDCMVRDSATATVPTAGVGKLKLTKVAVPVDDDGDGQLEVGEHVGWRFTVTNAGPTVLKGVGVSDPQAGRIRCGATTLKPAASTTCTAARATVVTAAMAKEGELVNTARAYGALGSGRQQVSNLARVVVDVAAHAPGAPGPRLVDTGLGSNLALVLGVAFLVTGAGALAVPRRRRRRPNPGERRQRMST